ncbi:23S rRNA (uracil(1939)-C(5))-methyltransferase RlmD [Paenibacillus xylaniclasticus]|uniref:23S rRNA (uracil(1939)-C(5))-methyltransferase RlmD n=1 Tax=Paenibacillus xylaniclasticus TaxID=588083 RepID=UPI00177790F2|nr:MULTISPECIES: 23S rRNA (uracil(1939)-C(5))-methyltransferase RlmD [Paenibacillus]GFN31669.1 tRNA (uracil-5-)-methyltransferase [Paenibacillus curdlanolyticus]
MKAKEPSQQRSHKPRVGAQTSSYNGQNTSKLAKRGERDMQRANNSISTGEGRRRSGEVSEPSKQTVNRSSRTASSNSTFNRNNRNVQSTTVKYGRHGAKGQAATAEDVRVGDQIVVTIKRVGINGEGVGYYKRKAVFINGALPEEVVKAKIVKVESGYLSAELVQIEKRSPDRQQPSCAVYDMCGGCQLQHMKYSAQLKAKEEIVRESFQRYAGVQELPMRPIIGMEDPWGYRNKAQLQTGLAGEDIITGLYAAGSHRLVDISGCAVQHPTINRVIDQVKQVLKELNIPIYNERTREGSVRTIVARIGQATGNVQLTFITATDRLPDSKRLAARIREAIPVVTTIAHNINNGKTPLIYGDKTIILWGNERLDEKLGNVKFALSPRAFFQLNPEQTVKLYNAAKEAAQLTGSELVVDAYCGTGTIGMWLAPDAREVRGIEVIAEAVKDARANAAVSGIENVRFYEGRAEQLLPEWVKQGIRPDVVVVDPPRTGCERPLLEALAVAKPKRIVYVSCNPSTLAKDCRVLLDSGYRLEWVQPVDMFPQTSHVECVILMEWRGEPK